ncbi:MAG: T9SS type A sorting domain-containing protein [Bacteroidetes bacterium]|nr:T9SS type A sorting domain-containing protein [Bacteroidota bacterium]
MVTIKVFDILGREIATIVNEVKQPGTYTVAWNATGFTSGVYFYKMQAGNFTDIKKMVLLK